MNNIYFEILDFVALVKKVEYCILEKYAYAGESVFRGVWDNVIPREGSVKVEGKNFNFYFHGSGVDFESEQKTWQYERSSNQSLGVFFTPMIHGSYANNPDAIKNEYSKLVNRKLIKQWMPEIPMSQVYCLV